MHSQTLVVALLSATGFASAQLGSLAGLGPSGVSALASIAGDVSSAVANPTALSSLAGVIESGLSVNPTAVVNTAQIASQATDFLNSVTSGGLPFTSLPTSLQTSYANKTATTTTGPTTAPTGGASNATTPTAPPSSPLTGAAVRPTNFVAAGAVGVVGVIALAVL
ncbi:MAG: hypothetical protein M1832_000163 [Thelocarpon impressellum]|nr:MAG: hypothetical protein M1832_000163 [Thelocarpon impressellum]